MSINSKLTAFAQNELVLGRTEAERDDIKASLSRLEKILKDRMTNRIEKFVRFGSFTRNTILPRYYDQHSDVDLMVVFDVKSGRRTPATYRSNLLDVLDYAYPNSISKNDFPAVKLTLNHIMFDIVPAYYEGSFYGVGTYYIPQSGSDWRSTVPNDLNDDLTRMNQSYGNNIVRNTIRLCKCWNAGANYPFDSYGMEKWIVNRLFFQGDNLYDKFLSVLNDLAGTRSGVRQALDWISEYKGGWSRQADEQKQFEWLKKLLPGFQ